MEEALKVAKAIQDKNAGKPWKPLFVAEALKIKLGSSNFREIAGSSHKYGLTSGSWSSDTISLTSLGAALTKPVDSKLEIKSRQEAVLKIDPFKRIFEHYRDSKFPSPEDKYFKNMLESEFGIPREHIDECVELLVENGKFADIIRESQGALYVVFAEEPLEAPPEVPKGEVVEGEIPPTEAEIPSVPKPTPTPPVINQIFVAHGKNTVPLEQLKKILNEFQVPFKVAIDEPHVGRPISQKVAELMRSCTSAIIIFTADEESTDQEGNKTYRPSDNVVYELGAASVLYGDKIVILKEEGVTLASDFNDLGYIPFEKDKIKAKAMDLIKELIGFGLLKVTPA
ncbi:MAG: nucleotide-binding protein [Candidatus Bathyarchaeota archaeon]|nr:nucleotide-binding protein [Candidatus Bathyarchaeota archaeon]